MLERKLLIILCLVFGQVFGMLAGTSGVDAQTLYRYKDDNGDWQFSDRKPLEKRELESERLTTRNRTPEVKIEQQKIAGGSKLVATNEWHCPMELLVHIQRPINLDPDMASEFTFVLQPDSTTDLMELFPHDAEHSYGFEMEYQFMPGDPESSPDRNYRYRMPFAKGTEFQISQAFPSRMTHDDESSFHAIDFAMPEGTPVYAVRDGMVFATSYENYTGGTNPERDMPKANVVRIAHDDGTMAVYAHLSWNAIRVKPGQRVRRGQYIADSGNTGFSSGPHLHFAVVANAGMTLQSVPVQFAGSGTSVIQPRTGETLSNFE